MARSRGSATAGSRAGRTRRRRRSGRWEWGGVRLRGLLEVARIRQSCVGIGGWEDWSGGEDAGPTRLSHLDLSLGMDPSFYLCVCVCFYRANQLTSENTSISRGEPKTRSTPFWPNSLRGLCVCVCVARVYVSGRAGLIFRWRKPCRLSALLPRGCSSCCCRSLRRPCTR